MKKRNCFNTDFLGIFTVKTVVWTENINSKKNKIISFLKEYVIIWTVWCNISLTDNEILLTAISENIIKLFFSLLWLCSNAKVY